MMIGSFRNSTQRKIFFERLTLVALALGVMTALPCLADPYQAQAQILQNLLFENPIQVRPGLQFVKMAMSFTVPVTGVRQISIQSCGTDFHDGVEIFAQPDSRRFYAEGGASVASVKFVGPEPVELQSLAFNFRHNHDLCIKSIVMLNSQGSVIPLKIAKFSSSEKGLQEKDSEKRRASFVAAGLEAIVDHELLPNSEDEKWIFRFRGDGTFFIYGHSDEERSGGSFSALGNFALEQVEPGGEKNTLRVVLNGVRFVTPGPWDGWYCGSTCGEPAKLRATPVADVIVLEKTASTGYVVRNRTNPISRSIPFLDIRVRPSTL